MSFELRAVGSNLEYFGTVIDGSGNGLPGETLTVIIQRLSDNKFWDGNSWEVGSTVLAVPDLGTGTYKLIMAGAYTVGVFQYRTTYDQTGVFNRNFRDEHSLDFQQIQDRTNQLPEGIKKATIHLKFPVDLVLASDGETPAVGVTVVAERSIDGGAYVSMTNSAIEVSAGSEGSYFIDLSVADTTSTSDFVRYKFGGTGSNGLALTKKINVKLTD